MKEEKKEETKSLPLARYGGGGGAGKYWMRRQLACGGRKSFGFRQILIWICNNSKCVSLSKTQHPDLWNGEHPTYFHSYRDTRGEYMLEYLGVLSWRSSYRIWLGTMKFWVRTLALLSGLGIWCCPELWCRLQMQLWSYIAVAVV